MAEGREFRHAAVRLRSLSPLVWGPWGGPLVTVESAASIKEREGKLRTAVAEAQSELQQLRAELRVAVMKVESNESEARRIEEEREVQREKRAKENRSRLKCVKSKSAHALESAEAVYDKEVRALTLKLSSLERKLAGKEHVEVGVHTRMQERYDQKLDAVQRELDAVSALYAASRERERARDAEEEEGGEEEGEEEERTAGAVSSGPSDGRAVPSSWDDDE